MASYIFSAIEENDKKKKLLLGKANSILVEIIKKEWNNSWKTAIKDIVQSSYQSQDVCENNLLILKELSEDIFEFSKNSMVASQVAQLKENFGREFSAVYEVCNFVAKSYLSNQSVVKSSLIKTCLSTLHSFLSWIPVYYVLMTDLIDTVLIPFLGTKKYLITTLKCFEEVFGMELPSDSSEIENNAQMQMYNAFHKFIAKLSVHYNANKDLELERKTLKKSRVLKDLTFFEMFCQNLSVCFLNFYKAHLHWLLKLCDQNANSEDIYAALLMGLQYMANMVSVKETSIFKTSLDFWLFVTSFLYNLYPNANGSIPEGNPDTSSRLIHSPILALMINNLATRTPKPEEVLIYIDDDGLPKHETLKDTETSSMYETCKEIFINFATLNSKKLQEVFTYKIQKQMDETEWSYENNSSLCYSCGCVAGVFDFTSESDFFTVIVRMLLQLTASKFDVSSKAVLASNIMYIVSQYKRFLINHEEFLMTVINKLFEFMLEHYPGVKEMACNTFLAIVQQVKGVLVNMRDTDNPGQFVIYKIINETPERIKELQPFQKIQFYEAMGVLISACDDINAKRDMVFMLMSHLEAGWNNILSNIGDASVLASDDVAIDICFFIKTNERVCGSVGEIYADYFNHSLASIDQIYKQYHWLIMNQLEQNGLESLKLMNVKRYRAVKKDILLLLTTFVSVIKNTSLFVEKYSELLLMALENYSNEQAEIREAEVLEFLATSIEVLKADIVEVISELIPHILNAVLPMITKDFSSYPEHRTGFFSLVRSLVKNCFEVFFKIPADLFKTIIDCVIWAIKHELGSIYEIGLETMNAILESVNQNLDFAEMFYKFYYQPILSDVLFVLLDGLHTNGFNKQCKTLYILINVLNTVRQPLFEHADNKMATYNYMLELMTTNFPNLAKQDHERLIKYIFEASVGSEKEFRSAVRDYMISLNLYTNPSE